MGDDASGLPRGSRIGDGLVVEQKLGQGGFGITYLATDAAGRKVAVKEYFPSFCAIRMDDGRVAPASGHGPQFDKFRDDFQMESLALSGFDHPNIVKVLNRFDANGTSYFVMEFVEGVGLDEAGADRLLSTEAVMLIAEGLIRGVKAVHEKNLLHRDIKPKNIRLSNSPAPADSRLPDISATVRQTFGRPVLLDFGAVRTHSGDGATMTGITTAGYGAPEQSTPRGRQDVRTDIYGLGATLYFCLSGQDPPDSRERMLQDLLVPAQQRFVGIAPPSFIRAIDRALRLQPDERPKDIRAFRSELFADLDIAEWTTPDDIATFIPPGSSRYAGRRPAAEPSPARRPSPAPSPSPAPASAPERRMWIGFLVGAAVMVGGAGAYFALNPGLLSGVGAATPEAPETKRIEAQFDLATRLIRIARTARADIKVHESTLAAAQGEEEMTSLANIATSAIASREADIEGALVDAKSNFAGMVAAARSEPAMFGDVSARMADAQADSGNPNTSRQMRRLGELAIADAQRGAVDEQGFLAFWWDETGD